MPPLAAAAQRGASSQRARECALQQRAIASAGFFPPASLEFTLEFERIDRRYLCVGSRCFCLDIEVLLRTHPRSLVLFFCEPEDPRTTSPRVRHYKKQ